MEIRQKFNDQMADVYQHILRMGALVEEALHKALTAVRNHDSSLATQVIAEDTAIDDYQKRIEDICTVIIATAQPVATDLRELVTIFKIVSDLERIGDHARHLAKSVTKVSEPVMARVLPQIQEMTERGISMVHQALTALSSRDSDKALAIAAMDSEIDRLHRALYSTILDIMKEHPDRIEEGTSLIYLNRFLERLGDHVGNICDWIVYARTGQHPELK